QHMHVIRHDHPGSELIEMPSALAIQQGMGHHICYTGIPQPNWSESSFVRYTVQGEKGPSGGLRRGAGAFACQPRRPANPMDPYKCQVANRKVASSTSGCQWGSF